MDEKVAEAVETSQPTIARVCKQYVQEGLEAAFNRCPPKREYRHKLDGEQEEPRLVALACSEPPEDQARWSLRLITSRQALVELERSWRKSATRDAQKNSQKRSQATPDKQWSILPKGDAD